MLNRKPPPPPTTKTAAFSSARHSAQKKLLDRIRKKYAKRMEAEMKRVLLAMKAADAIEKEMKLEFEEAIGDRDHALNRDATFEPFFTPGFKETKFLAETILHETRRLLVCENALLQEQKQ
jgi:hypothetical protein